MRRVKISLIDANTGEVLCNTKPVTIGSTRSLRSKISRNIDSFVRYLDASNNDVVLQIIVREERSPLSLFNQNYNVY